jgi:ParB family chromosome partitioning protein
LPSVPARSKVVPLIRSPQGTGIQVADAPAVRRLSGALELPVAQIRPDAQQPRRNWQHEDGERRLDELVRSIKEFGVLQPLLVGAETVADDGATYYPLIAGNRRLVAAKQAGLVTVPAMVRDAPATQVRILQLTENLQRQDLSPLDEARAYQELMDLEQWSPPQLAERLHLSETLVRNRLHLLDDQVLADAVEKRQIAASTARQILQLPDEERARFRARVERGEHIQTNDLAVARARLRAEGVPHPRRSPRPALPLAQPMPSPGPAMAPGEPLARVEASPVQAVSYPGASSMAPAEIEHGVQEEGTSEALPTRSLAYLLESADPRALALLRQLAHHGEMGDVDTQVLPLATRLLHELLRLGIAEDLSCRVLFAALWGEAHG